MTPAVLARFFLALAFAMIVPITSLAATITSTFLTSSSGTSTLDVSDTIQFEVTITTTAGRHYNVMVFSLTGDIAGALASTPAGWATEVAHVATAWDWYFTPPGSSSVDPGMTTPFNPFPPAIGPPAPVIGPYGFIVGDTIGTGVPSLVGTVTLHVNTSGVFMGGGYQYPGVDQFVGSAGSESVTVGSAAFTVVPELSSGILLFVGVTGIAIARRRVT